MLKQMTNCNLRLGALAMIFLTLLFLDINAQSTICPGDSATLSLSGYSGTIQWESSPDAITFSAIPAATSGTYKVSPPTGTWYRAVVTDGTCDPIYSDTMAVILGTAPVADAGSDTGTCGVVPATIGGSPTASGGTAPYTYSWSPSSGLSSTTAANPTALPTITTGYIVTIVDTNGCTDSDTTIVTPGAGGGSGTMTYAYTGAPQVFQIPICIDSITVKAWGAQGGSMAGRGTGGMGGYVEARISVSGLDSIWVYVGDAGVNTQNMPNGGYNGGGGSFSYTSGGWSGTGGGASDVRTDTTFGSRLVIAGGGGGHGGNLTNQLNGGVGGGATGGIGQIWPTWPNSAGKGGTQIAGGAAGIACCSCPSYTTSGALGDGGFGSGDGAGGGAGGGGYYGGGGSCFGSGGGGSSYVVPSGNVITNSQGLRSGVGQVIITW